jgi:DNA-binding cell septation regulator SpoVG
VINEIKLIRGKKGYVVSVLRTKRANGNYVDIVAPVNNETRQMIEDKVLAEYGKIAGEPITRRRLKHS